MMNFARLRGSASALILAVTLASSLVGCGSTFVMTPDATVPFAKGTIDASFQKGGNNKLVIKVEHLGPPAKLNPAATVYVVWIRPKGKEDAKLTNVGALKVDDDYSGELEFTTPFEAFDVSITPEKTADVTDPAGRDVLKAVVGN